MNGNAQDIVYITFLLILLCKKLFIIKSENIKNKILAIIPQIKLIKMQCFVSLRTPSEFPIASSSETKRVTAKFIPKVPKCDSEDIN